MPVRTLAGAYRPEGYAPYGVIQDPGVLSLREGTFEGALGRVYYVCGERTGPAVTLFLHGVGGTWATWTPLIQCAREHGVTLGDMVLVDLPGFGASELHVPHLDATEVGAVMWDLVRSLGWTQVTLVGHSMGGFLALDMASRGSPGLLGVKLVSGAYFSIIDTVHAPVRSLLGHRDTAVAYLSLAMLARAGPLGIRLLHKLDTLGLMPLLLRGTIAFPRELPASVVSYIARSVVPRSFLLAAQNGKHYDAAAQWSRITAPVRATFGRKDHLVPPTDMDRMTAVLPESDVVCLDRVGHFGHIERPGEVLEFLFEHR